MQDPVCARQHNEGAYLDETTPGLCFLYDISYINSLQFYGNIVIAPDSEGGSLVSTGGGTCCVGTNEAGNGGQVCDPGFGITIDGSGVLTCAECQAGSVSPGGLSAECTPCAAGTFVSTNGSPTSCTV
jgi:hypothetical protein